MKNAAQKLITYTNGIVIGSGGVAAELLIVKG
jgi:hypothetical protein